MSNVQKEGSRFGQELRRWRQARHLSQEALARTAGFSTRHLSFLETGRARPSRQAAEVLATALALTMMETNAFVLAAGFAPIYRSEGWQPNAPERRAIELLMARLEPYGAIVIDRKWSLLHMNDGAKRAWHAFGCKLPPGLEEPGGAFRAMFMPELIAKLENGEELLAQTVRRLRREAVIDLSSAERLSELTTFFPQVAHVQDGPIDTVLSVRVNHDGMTLKFFTFLTTLGTTGDAIAEELRIEAYLPVDAETDAWVRGLVDSGVSLGSLP